MNSQTHCHRGHPFTEANTYVRPDIKTRTCRACKREKWRKKHGKAVRYTPAGYIAKREG